MGRTKCKVDYMMEYGEERKSKKFFAEFLLKL